jgi:redox-sensitive bicupin YhaK (pirin superfamily)
MGFRALRVINEDRVAPGQGFGTHSHDNMEIVSYVLEGRLEHKDSMGNGEILHPGEFQCISAGTGIRHSEFNPSAEQPVHFYQIWLLPSEHDIAPSYEQKRFPEEELDNQLRLVASRCGDDGSLTIHQDARIYIGKIDVRQSVQQSFAPGRHGWLQVLRGAVELNGVAMDTSDGATISEEKAIAITATEAAEVMLFDLA